MKFRTFIIIKFVYFIFLISKIVVSLNLRSKNDPPFFNEDPEMVDSNRIPIINIQMEDHDDDPINFKRFDGERKTYSMKVNELHEKYENEKKALIKVITFQLSKIEHLTEIADLTNKLIEYQ
jgi:hypothetical protein